MASVSLENVGKVYRNRKQSVCALDDFCLSVADREFVVLVGPSGCGKTTTLRLIAGLETITEGVIKIGSQVVNGVQPKDRDVAMVFQNYALYPHMTVFKNIAFPLKMRRVPRADIRTKVHQVAELLGIDHLLDRKPRELSGGEKQRVAVGRAIVRKPKVFLFDEPLSNLDARLRLHMRTELKTLHRELLTTAIYVTHDQEEAMTLGDRLVIMKDGLVQQAGTPMEVYQTPANRFVAGFVGSPPMNFLQGHLDRAGAGAWVFIGAGGQVPLPQSLATRIHEDHLCESRSVVLGIRPEHLVVRQSGDPPGSSRWQPIDRGPSADAATAVLPMTVVSIEPLGDRTHVHLSTSTGERLVARMPPSETPTPQSKVDVHIATSHLHIFNANSDGCRLG